MRDAELLPFLRAIHDRPSDDLPRLIFADFLDELGDWRGPLLRRPAPPGPARDVEATNTWLDRLGNLHGVSWVGCRRGLLSVVMPADAVFELPDSHLLKSAFRQGWVEHLDLLDNAGIPWADQLELDQLPRLGFQTVNDETLENLPPLPAVRELYLNNCQASRTELAWLKDFTRLQWLHVSWRGNAAEADLDRLSAAPRLRSLRLDGDLANDALERVSHMSELEKLDVWGSHLTDTGIETLQDLHRLQELRIGSLQFTDAALEYLARLPTLRVVASRSWYRFTDTAVARFRAARPDVVIRR